MHCPQRTAPTLSVPLSLRCVQATSVRATPAATRRAVAMSAIKVGDKLPDSKFNYFDAEGNMQEIGSLEMMAGKKVVLFAVPGAFTPTCSNKHLPGFVELSDEMKAKGVATIACVAVNDAFVMDAWAKQVGAGDKVQMLADGSALFTKAIGCELDLTDKGCEPRRLYGSTEFLNFVLASYILTKNFGLQFLFFGLKSLSRLMDTIGVYGQVCCPIN